MAKSQKMIKVELSGSCHKPFIYMGEYLLFVNIVSHDFEHHLLNEYLYFLLICSVTLNLHPLNTF